MLVPVASTLKKNNAIFKLYGGKLVLDGLHFRLPADRIPAIAALPGGGQTSVGLTLESLAGPPARISLADGDAQDVPQDSAVALRPTVLVTDVNGNPVAGALVTFAVTAGGGRVEEAVQATGSDGRAAPAAWIPGAAVENQLQASTPGVNDTVTFNARSRAP